MTAAATVPPLRSLTTMQPFFTELAVNRETGLALLDELSPAQLAWRETPARWSLAEICTHLALTTWLCLPALDAAIARGHEDAAYSERPFQGNPLSRALVWFFEPPVRLRIRTTGRLQPSADVDPAEARHQYRSAQLALEFCLEGAAGLNPTHVRLQLPPVRVSRVALGTALAILLAHERRHLWQAARIRQSNAFHTTSATEVSASIA
jgi:DinB superfamily